MSVLILLIFVGFVLTAFPAYLLSIFTKSKEQTGFRISRLGSLVLTGLGLLLGLIGALNGSDGAPVALMGMALLPFAAGSWCATLLFRASISARSGGVREEIGLSPEG